MTSSITARGGTPATRQKILYDRTTEIILQFLDEGHSNPTPIQYTLTPVWQVLAEKDEYRIQAQNLQYYFDGFLNFGCDHLPGIKGMSVLERCLLLERYLYWRDVVIREIREFNYIRRFHFFTSIKEKELDLKSHHARVNCPLERRKKLPC